LARALGELVARGTRSTVHAYGSGAVIKVPAPSTPEGWIRAEAHYADAARGAGAPAPRLLGVEEVDGRAASVWERVRGTSIWQLVVDRPEQSAALGELLADVQHGLFELVPPVTLPRQRQNPGTFHIADHHAHFGIQGPRRDRICDRAKIRPFARSKNTQF